MLRSALVMVHAGAGLAGLVAGLATHRPLAATGRQPRVRRLYAWCVGVLLGSMVGMIAVDWPGLDPAARGAFTGLSGLGAVMAYRLWRAHHEARTQTDGWQSRYLGHVYFTYVSLWVGFLIVPALRLPSPQVAVPVVVVATLATGHVVLTRYKRRVLTPPAGRHAAAVAGDRQRR